jgi:hypothetical protein
MVKIMPGTSVLQRAGAAVVQHLRLFVEARADAVAAELAHHREAGVFGKGLDGVADVAQPGAGPTLTMPFHMASKVIWHSRRAAMLPRRRCTCGCCRRASRP